MASDQLRSTTSKALWGDSLPSPERQASPNSVAIERARHYLGMGYSATRVAELFGLRVSLAEWLKRLGYFRRYAP